MSTDPCIFKTYLWRFRKNGGIVWVGFSNEMVAPLKFGFMFLINGLYIPIFNGISYSIFQLPSQSMCNLFNGLKIGIRTLDLYLFLIASNNFGWIVDILYFVVLTQLFDPNNFIFFFFIMHWSSFVTEVAYPSNSFFCWNLFYYIFFFI